MRAIIDCCGFELALAGVPPTVEAESREGAKIGEVEFEKLYLPISEYRTYLEILLFRQRSENLGNPFLRLVETVAGSAQSLDLAVAAAAHHSIPDALHGIPLELLLTAEEGMVNEVLNVVRLRRHYQIEDVEAQLLAAAIHRQLPVLACRNRPGRDRTLEILQRYAMPHQGSVVLYLEHECSFQGEGRFR
ncbi:hypothetical protein [Rhodococcus sp. A5(2022)]|uniref:hypothetical protein n=1 Tax=Rhodococcus sp. A5(2022) TaxID=3003588 RepID=UPI0022A811C7|nr:hypothetical protein [Rhodococcus sp. A5(2022)]MCZ1075264.1 hypothetical protein [Rhodococcus sp. A5(2022)]